MKPVKAKDSNTNKSNGIDDFAPNNPRFDSKYQSSDSLVNAETGCHTP
jgi:hypothetical protein